MFRSARNARYVPSGSRVWIGGHNAGAKRVVKRYLPGTLHPPDGPIDIGFIVPKSADEGIYFLGKLCRRILRTGTIWVVYPKPESPRRGEFDGTRQNLIDAAAELGFVTTTPGEVDIDDDYTSLGFQHTDR